MQVNHSVKQYMQAVRYYKANRVNGMLPDAAWFAAMQTLLRLQLINELQKNYKKN
jgi:hypothetical protein